MNTLTDHFVDALQKQRGHRLPLIALFYGTGIGIYFTLNYEPSMLIGAGFATVAAFCLALGFLRRADVGGIFVALGVFCMGLVMAQARTQFIETPRFEYRHYGPVEGRVIHADLSNSGKPRLTLDRLYLPQIDPQRWPARLRISLHSGHDPPPLGARIGVMGLLSPPSGPSQPMGFDFGRHAYFKGLGALGYARSPHVILAPPPNGPLDLPIARLRAHISAGLLSALPARSEGVGVAIITGDRSHIPPEVTEALRASNLAHLLAISGLHMGLLTGVVFGALRLILVFAADHWPVRRLAALGAICAAAAYLGISGAGVASQRAFVMVLIFMGAILLGKRALTLRAVAIAALVILTLRPEALTGPGFQMSFAATTALVLIFRWMRARDIRKRPVHRLKPLRDLFVSSLIAGLATAPFAAVHFHAVAHYGLAANMLSVPIMGLVVMPFMALAAVLAPLGLAFVPLMVVDLGLSWIIGVAALIADLPNARSFVPAAPRQVLPLIGAGGLWWFAWQGRARYLGLALPALAVALWLMAERPLLLISTEGGLIGVMTDEGRALNKSRGGRFVAQAWLRADGDVVDPERAANRDVDWNAFSVGPYRFASARGRGRLQRILQACAQGRIVISHTKIKGRCRAIDTRLLRKTGALALYPDGKWRSARVPQSTRPWLGGSSQQSLEDLLAPLMDPFRAAKDQ